MWSQQTQTQQTFEKKTKQTENKVHFPIETNREIIIKKRKEPVISEMIWMERYYDQAYREGYLCEVRLVNYDGDFCWWYALDLSWYPYGGEGQRVRMRHLERERERESKYNSSHQPLNPATFSQRMCWILHRVPNRYLSLFNIHQGDEYRFGATTANTTTTLHTALIG